MESYKIVPASKTDAPYIARAIMEAVGEEIINDFAGTPERVPLVHQLFTRLAEAEDSQYSYLNTLVAKAADGSTAGVIVAYDGADLRRLRLAFYREAENVLGIRFEEDLPDETSPDEVYLDSLAVFPEHRGMGLATKLIEAAENKYKSRGKPLGLLVDPANERAYKLYRRLGFEKVGIRPFADTMMDHLQRPLSR